MTRAEVINLLTHILPSEYEAYDTAQEVADAISHNLQAMKKRYFENGLPCPECLTEHCEHCECGRCQVDDAVYGDMTEKVTRIEVIDETGRAYVRYGVRVELDLQDEGRTLKVLVKPEEVVN